jgi:hypothetical protein
MPSAGSSLDPKTTTLMSIPHDGVLVPNMQTSMDNWWSNTRDDIKTTRGHHPDNLSKKVTETNKARLYQETEAAQVSRNHAVLSRWTINRYQLLYDGALTPLPNLEEFHSPKTKAIEQQDGPPVDRKDQLEQQGVQGVGKL